MGVQKIFTTAYHPQANRQAEHFNRTIVAQLRNYVSKSQRDWDEWLEPLTCAYNMQAHRSTGTTPFDLVLSRHPPSLLMEEDVREHLPQKISATRRTQVSSAKLEFLKGFEVLMEKARASLRRTHGRYKRDFDAPIRTKLRNLKPGCFVYREIAEHPAGVNPKLAPQVDGPFGVLSNEWPVIVTDGGGRAVCVNANRLVRAPTPRRRRNPADRDGSLPIEFPHSSFPVDKLQGQKEDGSQRRRTVKQRFGDLAPAIGRLKIERL